MRYSSLRDYLQSDLTTRRGYAEAPFFAPGPADDDAVDQVPGAMVVLTLGGGGPLEVSNLYDTPFAQIEAIGAQFDYDGAAKLATDLDRGMLRVDSAVTMGGVRVLAINRQGGAPSPLRRDDGERYHFVCGYVLTVESELD
jgi:hypothetical protein